MRQLKWQRVSSTAINSVSYKHAAQELYIEFNTGHVYRYDGVPRKTLRNLLRARSVGKYFHQHIKGQYDFDRVS